MRVCVCVCVCVLVGQQPAAKARRTVSGRAAVPTREIFKIFVLAKWLRFLTPDGLEVRALRVAHTCMV